MSEFGRAVYRAIFAAAAVYNTAFGLWAALAPRAFFEWFDLDPPRYPAIWACLGMVVGLYGVGYAYAAWRLDQATPFIAIGLAGKVLGPIGWTLAVRSHELPFRTIPLIVFDDLMWWVPFALFLVDSDFLKRTAPYWCAAVHLVAAVGTVVFLRPGADHARVGWLIWMIAAQTLLGFYAWWGARVPFRFAMTAFVIAMAGIFCDYAGESLFLIRRADRIASLLTGGAANALYTIAGVTLTLVTQRLRPWALIVWTCGAVLTVVTIAGQPLAIMISSAALMIAFIPFAIALGLTSR